MAESSPTPQDIDAYIAAFPPEVQRILEKIRRTVREAAPGAREVISYRMPAFKQNGVLVYFAAFKNHIGLYPPVGGDAGARGCDLALCGRERKSPVFSRPADSVRPDRKDRPLRVEQDLTKAGAKKKKTDDRRLEEITMDYSRVPTHLRGLIYRPPSSGSWIWIAAYVRRSIDNSHRNTRVALSHGPGARSPRRARRGGLYRYLRDGRAGDSGAVDPPRRLSRSGRIGTIRNPMYLGAAAVIPGVGLAIASPALVLLTVGFLFLMHLFVVLHEEGTLTRRFGESYRRYHRRPSMAGSMAA